ncbi:SulP family sulfate permease [Anoxybacillus kamchatkensis]|nr:SulP family sulfate permease [Anoxybacillus ayderensis]
MERFQGYTMAHFQKDALSGFIVGVIALPLGMAFAIASGVKPEYGIYTTIVAGILISLFGGSKYQIGGPTGAFIPILLGIVLTYGYENLLVAGFLSGIMLVLFGVLRLGSLIKFIPRPVTIGFTAGIAVIIFTGQIPNFLGLNVKKHEAFVDNMKEIWMHLNDVNIYSVIIASIGLVVLLFAPKFAPKIPSPLLSLVVSSLFGFFLFENKVATIGSVYGEIPNTLPHVSIPNLTLEHIYEMIRPAFVIAMLGAIESLLSAVVADGMTGEKHHSNRELIGQGIANIVTPFFGGIPATGAIARTATNIKSGATSPLSGVIHGVVVLVILLIFSPYASHIPLASMAPILMIVAWNMSERKEFIHVLKMKSADSIVLVITFVLTIFVNLTVAVEVGLILAVLLFVKRMTDVFQVFKVLPDEQKKKVTPRMVEQGRDCPQISIYTIDGPLFFGVAQMFEQSIMATIHHAPRVLILRMSKVPYMDQTGEANLASLVGHFQSKGGIVLVSGIQQQPKEMLKRSGLYDKIGAENFFEHTGEALKTALSHINRTQCVGCKHYAFSECRHLCHIQGEQLKQNMSEETNEPRITTI